MVFPYLKGLVIIKCGFFYLALWIYCVFSICGDYICRSIQVLLLKFDSIGNISDLLLIFLIMFVICFNLYSVSTVIGTPKYICIALSLLTSFWYLKINIFLTIVVAKSSSVKL
jgi:hypothetical protein